MLTPWYCDSIVVGSKCSLPLYHNIIEGAMEKMEKMEKSRSIVEFIDVSRVYKSGTNEYKALDKVDMKLDEGKFVVILGPSGAGKSTLLNLLGGLDSPTSGQIYVEGKDIATLSNNELSDYRASQVGFIFQFYNLIPALTVHENVKLVHENAPNAISATKVLEEVGLSKHLKKFPSELSGGEQQRGECKIKCVSY